MATKKKKEYIPIDNSGTDYAAQAGMSQDDRDALSAAQSEWQKANAQGNQEAMDIWHQQAEAVRSKYDYSGGSDGSQYISSGSSVGTGGGSVPTVSQGFSYDTAPSYINQYQDQIDALTQQIMGREAFSYDHTTDPLYQQYEQSYTQAGERAMQDTLGQVSARTGGLASSYAGSAAQQSYNGYMGALADTIPELQQLAYSMYMDEGNQLYNQLAALQGLEQTDYGRYTGDLSQYNTDRNMAYGMYQDDLATDRYNTEWNYGVQQDALDRDLYADEQARAEAAQMAEIMAGIGDFSGFADLGYSEEQINALTSAYQQQQMAAMYSGGGGGGGGSSSSGLSDNSAEMSLYTQAYNAGIRTEGEALDFFSRYSDPGVSNIGTMAKDYIQQVSGGAFDPESGTRYGTGYEAAMRSVMDPRTLAQGAEYVAQVLDGFAPGVLTPDGKAAILRELGLID